MSFEYDISIDGQDYRVRIERLDRGGLLVVRVGDETFTLKTSPNEDGTWSVSDQASSHVVRVVRRMGRNATIELDGVSREVEWKRVHRTVAAQKAPEVPSGGGGRQPGGVYPPMPGKITEVLVSVGDRVEEGQTVCILEAMKMFNELQAPCSGTVREVNVTPGATVKQDDLLVLIE